MKKYCIFDSKKICNNCGECDRCDLNPDKKCNNCGKCLEMQGIDTKAIKIANVVEDPKEAKVYEELMADEHGFDKIEDMLKQEYAEEYAEEENDKDSSSESLIDDDYTDSNYKGNEDILDDEDVKMEYIDDIDGLKELLQDQEKLKSVVNEEFPGFFVINNKKNKDK